MLRYWQSNYTNKGVQPVPQMRQRTLEEFRRRQVRIDLD